MAIDALEAIRVGNTTQTPAYTATVRTRVSEGRLPPYAHALRGELVLREVPMLL